MTDVISETDGLQENKLAAEHCKKYEHLQHVTAMIVILYSLRDINIYLLFTDARVVIYL